MEAVAKLRNYPTGPTRCVCWQMLFVAWMQKKALRYWSITRSTMQCHLLNCLKSAMNNWEQKNEGKSAADANLVVKTVFVDGGRTLKRMRPAPQAVATGFVSAATM